MATIGHYEKLRALCGTTKLLILGGVREGESSQVVVFDHVANKTKLTIDLPSHVLGVALFWKPDLVRLRGRQAAWLRQ